MSNEGTLRQCTLYKSMAFYWYICNGYCSDREMLCVYSDIVLMGGWCVVLMGHRQWSEVAIATSRDRCGQLPLDWWRSPAVTGGIIQSDVYSGEEQTCLSCSIKLLCIHPMKQSISPAIVLYEMLLL